MKKVPLRIYRRGSLLGRQTGCVIVGEGLDPPANLGG